MVFYKKNAKRQLLYYNSEHFLLLTPLFILILYIFQIFSTGLRNLEASCIIIIKSETCLRIFFHLASLASVSRSSISCKRSEIPGKAEAPYKLNFPGAKMALRVSGRPGRPNSDFTDNEQDFLKGRNHVLFIALESYLL